MDKNFVPLLFAGDINVYSVARAFYEEYGVKPVVFGKYETWPCYQSEIMHYTANGKADQQETFLTLVNEFAEKNKDKQILLIGCGDSYVQLISENKGAFPNHVIAPYIPIEMMNELIHKEKFYAMCEENGVDYPNTFVHRKELGNEFELPFEPPFIIKPANGIEYWRFPFATQKKVYKVNTREELEQVLGDIYQSGYSDSIIIQDFIPGDDTYMWVLTNYSDQHGQVKMMCLGHVLLEEHTPHGIGNHAVIITEDNQIVEAQFKNLLEKLGYIGFSNFDIKYDKRDGKFKVFEINTRQGRSNYYVTGAGANVANYLVEDYIYNKPMSLEIVKEKNLWMVVPKGVAFKYVTVEKYKKEMKALINSGNFVNPLYFCADCKVKRRLRLFKSQIGHYFKFKKYLGKQKPE